MKTARCTLRILFACVLLLAALAFFVIEGRLLVSGDWLLHEMPALAFLTYFSRFALTVLAGWVAIRMLKPKK